MERISAADTPFDAPPACATPGVDINTPFSNPAVSNYFSALRFLINLHQLTQVRMAEAWPIWGKGHIHISCHLRKDQGLKCEILPGVGEEFPSPQYAGSGDRHRHNE